MQLPTCCRVLRFPHCSHPHPTFPAPNLTFAPTLLPSPFLSSGVPGAMRWVRPL